LVGNATRFVVLAKRLEEGMKEIKGNQVDSKKEDREESKSRALARTALLVAEMSKSRNEDLFVDLWFSD